MADNVLQSFVVTLKHQIDPASEKKFQDSIKSGIDGLNTMRVAAVAAMVGVEMAIRKTTASFAGLGYLATSAGVSVRELERLRAAFVGAGMDAQRASSNILALNKAFMQPQMKQYAEQVIGGPFKDAADFMTKAAAKYAEAIKLSGGDESRGAALQLRTQLQAIDGLDFDGVRNMAQNLQRAQANAAAMDKIYDQIQKNLGITATQMAQRSQDMENMFWKLGETLRISFAAIITDPKITAAIEQIGNGIAAWMISDATQQALKQFLDAIGDFISKKENIDQVADAFKSIGDAIVESVNGIAKLVGWIGKVNDALKPVADTLNWITGADTSPNADTTAWAMQSHWGAKYGPPGFLQSPAFQGTADHRQYQHGGIVSANLHEGEMVLPAQISEGLQAFFMGGAGQAGSMGASSARLLMLFQGWFSGDSSYKPVVELGDQTLTIMGYQTGQTGAPGGGAPGGGGGFGPGGGGGGAMVPSATKGNFRQVAMDYFTSRGWSKEQAAGIVANLETESRGNATSVGDRGRAFGIGQWRDDDKPGGGRQGDFMRVFGHSIRSSTLQEQLAFVDWEMHNTESRAGAALRAQTSAQGAGAAVSRFYERPHDIAGGMASRGRLATSIFGSYQAGAAPTMTESSPEAMGKAVDSALGMVGQSVHAPFLRQFVKAGAHLDPAAAAWCAAFVNSSMKAVGASGDRSNIATDFSRWGHAVGLNEMMKGDVGVAMHGLAAGMTGGHAVFMTGLKRWNDAMHREEVQTVGREHDIVNTRWRPAADLIFRRSNDIAATMQAHLGSATPGSHLMAGGGASLHRQEVTINVHGNDDPSATAKMIQHTTSRVAANHLRNLRSPVV